MLVLPVENVLVLAEIQKTEAPKHDRERSLFQSGLTQSQIDRVVTKSHFLLKKTEQSGIRLGLWIAAGHHGGQSSAHTLASGRARCQDRRSWQKD